MNNGGNKMKKIKVNPGVCGLESIIIAEKKGRKDVTVSGDSKCPAVKKMIETLEQPLDGYSVVFDNKPGTGPIYAAASVLTHAACPVAAAVVKCIEAECGLALPRTTTFTFEE